MPVWFFSFSHAFLNLIFVVTIIEVKQPGCATVENILYVYMYPYHY